MDKHDIKALDDDQYPAVTIAVAELAHFEPNHEQKTALFRKWKQNDQNMTWKEFAQTVGIGGDGCVMVQWCGMWLGIETDGYCHS